MMISTLKRFFLPLMAAILLISSCKNSEVSNIKGTVNNIDSQAEVKLYRQDFDKLELISSSKLTPKKNSFAFNIKVMQEPTFFQLHFEGKQTNIAVLMLEPTEKVTIDINLLDFINYTVTGSVGSTKTQILTKQLAKTIKSIDSLKVEQSKLTSKSEKQLVINKIEDVIQKQRDFSTKYIWDNPTCRTSVMALYQKISDDRFIFDSSDDIQLFKVVASSLIARYPESNYAKGMMRDIKNQQKILSSVRVQQLIQSAESSIPDIQLPNAKGEIVKLSSLKGKVVLLDFWASANVQSMMENRELIEIYRKYKSKGFEIYQVSLDVDREPWLAAIESIGMPWINVCELNPNGSSVIGLYNVTRIPANYLISRDHSIAGKNLFGAQLEKKLKEIL
jgi:thiol-disulfide isomerase/thioredoxin